MNSKLFRSDTVNLVGRVAPRAPRQGNTESGGVSNVRGARGATRPTLRRPSERGVALVVTLILLVVITTLAVAFLSLSHRETIAVSGSGSTITAEYAADAGFNRAIAQSLAQIAFRNTRPGMPYGTNNDLMGPEMMVSVPVDTNRAPSPLFPNGSLGMIRNPSPPVIIWTNKTITDPNDPRARDDR